MTGDFLKKEGMERAVLQVVMESDKPGKPGERQQVFRKALESQAEGLERKANRKACLRSGLQEGLERGRPTVRPV